MSPVSLVNSKITRLRDRAVALKQARDFFYLKEVTEVDTPMLSSSASIDTHIDLITALYKGSEKKYLHSSPEFGMKRLIVEGMGDVFQLSHVFRDGEYSVKHNPEFMMAEWYRLGFSLEQMMAETAEFICTIIGKLPVAIISYREAFKKYTDIDYLDSTIEDILNYMERESIHVYPEAVQEGKDGLLNLILGLKIEPQLGLDGLCILAYYPSSQAALAKKRWISNEEVSERFEIYYRGIELANGYHELADAVEQRARFEEANQARENFDKNRLPIDENFLSALEKGLPDCCGVAVGFDRLILIRQNQKELGAVLAWDWESA
jgi:elongation factor P--(R)-beta-lysine ligase